MRSLLLRRPLAALALLALAPAATAQAPTGLLPNGQTTSIELDLDWAPVAGAASYRVQLSTGRTFHADSLVALPGNGIVSDDAFSIRANAPRLANATRYFWRVRATGQAWSAPASFTTVAPGAAPGADYPSAGLEVMDTTPEFTWNLGTGGTGFLVHLQVREASAPADWSETVISEIGTDLRRFRPAPGVLRDSAAYVWRVRALVDPSSAYYGWGLGAHGTLRTVGASLDVPFRTRSALVNAVANWPTGTNVEPQPSFSWYAEMPGTALTYDLEIVPFASAFTGTPTVSGLTARTYAPSVPLAEGTRYRWRGRACTVSRPATRPAARRGRRRSRSPSVRRLQR